MREVSVWKVMRLQTWNSLKDLILKFLIITWSLIPRLVVPENGKMSLRYKIQSQKKREAFNNYDHAIVITRGCIIRR